MSAFKAILKRLSLDDEAKIIQFRVAVNASGVIEEAIRELSFIDLTALDEFSSAQRSLSAIIDDLNKLQCAIEIRAMQIRQDILSNKYDAVFDIGGKK